MIVDAIPSFESAYADRSITAWVCLNDDLAVGAHQFLQRKGIRKRRAEIIGFDNTLLTQKMGISSFDFGFVIAQLYDGSGRLVAAARGSRCASLSTATLSSGTCMLEISAGFSATRKAVFIK